MGIKILSIVIPIKCGTSVLNNITNGKLNVIRHHPEVIKIQASPIVINSTLFTSKYFMRIFNPINIDITTNIKLKLPYSNST
jgi:hypothetical protein